ESPVRGHAPSEGTLVLWFRGQLFLLTGTCIRCWCRSPCGLRPAQVTCRRVLADLVDYQFHRLAGSAGVEENGFVDRTILLFKILLLGQTVDGVWFFFFFSA